MTIQRRNILLLAVFTLLFLLAAWGIVRQVLMAEFLRLEEREHNLHIRQLHHMLAEDQRNLLAQAQDWGAWDETYQFVAKPTAEYLESGFAAGGLALTGLDLDLLLIVDREGKTVYGEVFDPEGALEIISVGGRYHRFFGDNRFLELIGGEEGVTAYVMQGDRPLLLAVYPVLTSRNQGPSRGAVVMGRFLSEARIDQLSERFQYPLRWCAKQETGGTNVSDGEYLYHLELPAFGEEKAGTLFFTERREVYRQGERTVLALIGYFAAATLGMMALLYAVQERYLFARIRKLDDAVKKAPQVLNEPYRIEGGNSQDEVDALTKRINRMLMGLYEKRQQEIKLHHQERLADMGKVVAIIAHEWRQPLNLVSLILQGMLEDFKAGRVDEAYLKQHVGVGMREILKMSDTITEFGRIYRPATQKRRFSLREELQRGIEPLTGRCAVTLEGEDIAIDGYATEFKQAVMALLHNALEAIEAHRRDGGRIAVRIFTEPPFACVSVEDNGGGIPVGQMERIFEPYYSTKGVMQGVGNGLFMVKMAIERGMGGKVSVENTGEGVRATICLPVA